MSPVIAFVVVVAAFAGAFAVALHSGRAALRDTRAALHAAAAAHGWRLEFEDGDDLAFRLRGRSSDGIDWTLRGDGAGATAGDAITPSIVWSTAAGGAGAALVLVVQSRKAYEGLRHGTGLAIASGLVAARGFASVPLDSLYSGGHEFALQDPTLAKRFVVVTTDDGVAAAALGRDVQQALRRWRPEQISIWVGRDLRVCFESGQLGSDDISALVALGLAVAHGCRSASGSAIA